MALQQRREHAGGIDPSHLGDLERGGWLLVGNDRQRFERLHRELLRGPLVEQPPHPLVQLRLRDDLISAGHFDQLQPARPLIVALERLEGRFDVFFRLAFEQLEEHLRRKRIGRRENQCFDDRLQFVTHRFVRFSFLFFVFRFFRYSFFAASGSPIGTGASTGRALR